MDSSMSTRTSTFFLCRNVVIEGLDTYLNVFIPLFWHFVCIFPIPRFIIDVLVLCCCWLSIVKWDRSSNK
jgi:hypothetical protein